MMKKRALVFLALFVSQITQASRIQVQNYNFLQLESELANLSDAMIRVNPLLPPEARSTTFKKVGVTFYTDQNSSGLNPQDFFELDVPRFTISMNTPDFLSAKQSFYSRLRYSNRSQRHFRPYAYLESWRSLFHPQLKTLPSDLTVIDQGMTPKAPGERANSNSPYFDPKLQREIDSFSGTELTLGNKVELRMSNDSFEHKIEMIRRAKKSFLGIVMVLNCDDNGSRFVDELIKAKNRGVDVKMMHEEVWTKVTNSACERKMRRAGIDVVLPSDMISNHFVLGVVHNKFYIRDEEEAVIGGQNLVDAETKADGFNHYMIDADIWIHSGPEVTTLQHEFAILWQRYAKGDQRERILPYLIRSEQRMADERVSGVRGEQNYETWFSDPSKRMNGVCRSVVQKYGRENLIGPVLKRYAEVAQSRIIATTPYIKYHDSLKKTVINDLLNTLNGLGRRGVKVDVVTNGIDGATGSLAVWFRDEIAKAKESVKTRWKIPVLKMLYRISGITETKNESKSAKRFMKHSPSTQAWAYSTGNHSKQMFFDRTLFSVGSFNLDHHSSHTNHEAQIFCLDENLADEADRELTLTLANSIPFPR